MSELGGNPVLRSDLDGRRKLLVYGVFGSGVSYSVVGEGPLVHQPIVGALGWSTSLWLLLQLDADIREVLTVQVLEQLRAFELLVPERAVLFLSQRGRGGLAG